MDSSEKAIIKTLIYSDIFDYPLSEKEVFDYLISETKINKKKLTEKIKKINTVIFRKNNHLFIKGRGRIVQKRIRKTKESIRKLKQADKIIQSLSLIPTILFIGISGNLSMFNADKKDDIDLFVISRKNTVWITRLILILYLKIMGKYRKKGEKNVSDKICLNMIIDETALELPSNLKNLYTAHEVCQLKPIIERDNYYAKFIDSNKWVSFYLPNILEKIRRRNIKKRKNYFYEKIFIFLIKLLPIEFLAKTFQMVSIRKNITLETVSDNFLAFHPTDYKSYILKVYNNSLLKYAVS